MIIKIYLGKNKDKTAEKHPDLKIATMIQGQDGKTVFIPSGALWKSKNGSGYVGEIDTEAKPYQKKEKAYEADTEGIQF